MPSAHADESLPCRFRWRLLLLALSLAASFGLLHAEGVRRHGAGHALGEDAGANQLSIQVNNDRLTLAVAKAPQVYLYGVIDAGAPRRFEALMRTWKIPSGSDVYMNSPGGDLQAALALGRLFRAGAMVTHLGTPRRKLRSGPQPKTAVCLDACAFAYAGGLYRWAPTGDDRIGLHAFYAANQKASGLVADYVKAMGVAADALMPAPASSRDDVTWLSPDAMFASGLANNGRQPLTAAYRLSDGAPYLTFDQTVRGGENRITLLCRPDGITLTAYYMVGAGRARQILARGVRSYFEIEHREMLPPQRGSLGVVNQAVVFSRTLPFDQLARVLSTYSVGAWIADRNGAVRYGFTIGPVAVRNSTKDYYARCAQVMQRPYAPKT